MSKHPPKVPDVRTAKTRVHALYEAHAEMFNAQNWLGLKKLFRKSMRVYLSKTGVVLATPQQITDFWKDQYDLGMRNLAFSKTKIQGVYPVNVAAKHVIGRDIDEMICAEVVFSYALADKNQTLDPVLYSLVGHWEVCLDGRESEILPF